jgi:glycosyltransferase involved in cell wall biosynthesis
MQKVETTYIDVFYYCFNQEDAIERALDSIKSQKIDYPIKLIVCDDGSKDMSAQILEMWVQKNSASLKSIGWEVHNISHQDTDNRGQVATLREGLMLSSGAYLAILEGDDHWIRVDHLSSAIEILNLNIIYSAVFSSWISLKDDGSIAEIRQPHDTRIAELLFDFQRLTVFNAPATLSCMVYRGAALCRIKQYLIEDQKLSDLSLNLTIATQGPIYWSSNLAVAYTFNPNSIWRTLSTNQKNLETARIIEDRMYHLNFAPSQLTKDTINRLVMPRSESILTFAMHNPVKFLKIALQKIYKRLSRSG